MYEVEVKVRADHDAVRDRLGDIGGERVGRVVQEDTYYDAPHRDFAATDEALRIRRERPADADDCEARVTYKGPLVDDASKTREEFETGVADGETMAAVLDGLGFDPAATVRKERERYAVGDYVVTLDAVDGLGEFVEVETETDEAGVDAAREGAFDLLDRLGLDPDEGIRTSYLGLLLG
ncbi:class IV adenylate cyclase [Halostella litorea]|uniref:class IV adenylate cyclase n=1 Tax=Halostella litorea TaxID=2528831 RepID=UPI001092BF9E|nr:class IV adenylate cyclase [Halostella litorea]